MAESTAPTSGSDIWEASAAGDLVAVETFLSPSSSSSSSSSSGVDVDTPQAGSFHRYTALHLAASRGHERVVKALLARGADANRTTFGHPQRAALHMATEGGHYAVMALLLDEGKADVDKPCDFESALIMAARAGDARACTVLLDRRADVAFCTAQKTALHFAAEKGRMDVVELLVKRGARVETDNGNTPLHYAAERGHADVCKFLISVSPASVNARSRGERGEKTPLHYAAEAGAVDVARLLVDAGADVECRSDEKYFAAKTPLLFAAYNGHVAAIDYLLSAKANIKAFTADGKSAVMLACEGGRVDALRTLLRHGASPTGVAVGAVDDAQAASFALEPLHVAAQQNACDIASVLIDDGKIDVNRCWSGDRGYGAYSPLHFAAESDSDDVARLLIERYRADVNLQSDKYGLAPLHLAAEKGAADMVKLLLSSRANASIASRDGRTPLHNAADGGHDDIVKALIAAGANINAALTGGAVLEQPDEHEPSTPLQLAAENGHADVVALLLDHAATKPQKCDLNAASRDQHTALHFAAEHGHLDCVGLLLQRGAKLKTKSFGRTPIDLARANGHVECLKLLEKAKLSPKNWF